MKEKSFANTNHECYNHQTRVNADKIEQTGILEVRLWLHESVYYPVPQDANCGLLKLRR